MHVCFMYGLGLCLLYVLCVNLCMYLFVFYVGLLVGRYGKMDSADIHTYHTYPQITINIHTYSL